MVKNETVKTLVKQDAFQLPSIKDSGFINEQEAKIMVDMLDTLDDEIEITSEYLVPEKDVPYRCFFLGIKTIKTPVKDGEAAEANAVRLLMDDGSFKLCASTMLVNNLIGLPEKTPILFVKTGQGLNSSKQKYDQFSIKLLGKKD